MRDEDLVRRVRRDDAHLVGQASAEVFDNPVDAAQLGAFLADPGHEMVVALSEGHVVGFASGTVLLHPDKPPAFLVNEVGVVPARRREGIGTALVDALLSVARARGCRGTWLATEAENDAARALYRRAGARETAGIVVYDWDGALDD